MILECNKTIRHKVICDVCSTFQLISCMFSAISAVGILTKLWKNSMAGRFLVSSASLFHLGWNLKHFTKI